MKPQLMTYTRRVPTEFTREGWQYETLASEVRVMAEAEGWVMVRHKRAMPFVVRKSQLSEVATK